MDKAAIDYSKHLTLLHALCVAETLNDGDGTKPDINLSEYTAVDSAHFLASYITFKAIHAADRNPPQERTSNFDMLSVYQAYATLIFVYLTRPIEIEDPEHKKFRLDFSVAQIVIAKTIFDGLPEAHLVEIIESGFNKFKLIADAKADHWIEFRENLDKLTLSFVVAGIDDNSPHSKEEVLPYFGQMLSQFCEAFAQD